MLIRPASLSVNLLSGLFFLYHEHIYAPLGNPVIIPASTSITILFVPLYSSILTRMPVNINEINKPGNTFIPKRYRPDITPSHTGTDNAEKINRSNNSMLIIRPL